MRTLCEHCQFPIKNCICHAVQTIDTNLNILIIQHKTEAKHAKNTVKLAKLCLPKLHIHHTKTHEDLLNLLNIFKNKRFAIFYPIKECSRNLANEGDSFKKAEYDGLIFIDASWKQAKGIYRSLSQLINADVWSLPIKQSGEYYIRHSKINNGVSTLEAIAKTIEIIEESNVKAMLNLLHEFQKNWQGTHSTQTE